MFRRLAARLGDGASVEELGLLLSKNAAKQLPFAAAVPSIALDAAAPHNSRSYATLCSVHQQLSRLFKQPASNWQPLQQTQAAAAAAAAGHTLPPAAAAAQQAALLRHPWQQQLQQQRLLLGVVQHKNYQDHNQKKPPKYKIKTPSAVKRRVLVGEDGTMWRMQAGRRHKRYKKGRKRLLGLKGMVPLHRAHSAKLRKLGYKRRWWHMLKA